jgi:hypothetical protein
MKKLKLHGYSERGVVNAVFETIASHPEGAKILDDLLGRMVLWENRYSVRRFANPERRLVDFEIFVEPSLSDFGNPDVVVCYRATPMSPPPHSPRT